MTNAAHELSDMLNVWTVGENESVWRARGRTINSSEYPDPEQRAAELWRRFARALHLVEQIESILIGLADTGEDVGAFLERVPAWYAAVALPDRAWNDESQHAAYATLSAEDSSALRMLAAYLNQAGLPDVGETDSYAELHDALLGLEELVLNESTLPTSARAYLLGLIDRARWTLNNGTGSGAEDLRRLSHEISGAAMATAESGVIPTDRKPLWLRAARAVAVTVVVPAAAAAGAAIGGRVTQELSAGGGDTPVTRVVVDVHQQPNSPLPPDQRTPGH